MAEAIETLNGDATRARALSAPTRVQIMDHLRAAGPASVREVAEAIGIHANVARGHLDILVGAELASVGWRRNPSGGRPAKVYEAAPIHVEEGPALVSDMLATLIEVTAPAPGAARQVAEATGERLVRRIKRDPEPEADFDRQVELLTRALTMVSGGVRIVDRGEDWIEIVDKDCPFRAIAADHPETACTLDKALKEGMVHALGADAWVEVVTSVAWGDPECREVVRWRKEGS
ncbi:MAG: helix-turn-helix transcriptional regulator [Actinomycetota bacterium]